jgi:hypothetical protein
MRIPIGCRAVDRISDLVPALEAPTGERARAQDHPPRLDQIEISGILGLEHHLPARMREQEQPHVRRAMRAQIVEDRVHPLGPAWHPGFNPFQKVDPRRTAAPWIGMREGSARGRTEGPEDVAHGAAAVVDLLPGPLGRSRPAPHQRTTGITIRTDWAHFVEADHTTAGRWLGVERFDLPFIRRRLNPPARQTRSCTGASASPRGAGSRESDCAASRCTTPRAGQWQADRLSRR